MAVKYFSTENSPLLDERCYVRDDEIQMDDYSSVSSSSTDTFKSSSPIPYLNDNPVQSTFRRHTVLFLASFASLCIVLVFLTGYSLYGHEQYHNSLHGKGKQSRSRDGNLDSNGDASNTTASNTSADIDSQIKKRGTHNKKRNRKRHEDQIIAERAFRKHLVDHSSLNKNLPYQCHAQIIIIRHCEKKGSIRGHCNRVGYERAEYIATFFSNNKDHDSEIEDLNHIHVPSYLFATSPGHRNPHVKNYREIETLQPLSSMLGVEINSKYGMNNKEELTKHLFELLKHGDLCGKVALISWKHDDVPRLARSLGCGPEDGCPTSWRGNDFDSTWRIQYSYHNQQISGTTMANVKAEDNKNEKRAKVDNDKLNAHLSSSSEEYHEWGISAHVGLEGFDPSAFKKAHKNHSHHQQD